jgi:hypothetical protein
LTKFIISRGLLNGEQGLKMDLNEIKIDKSTRMANHIPAGSFEPTGQIKFIQYSNKAQCHLNISRRRLMESQKIYRLVEIL